MIPAHARTRVNVNKHHIILQAETAKSFHHAMASETHMYKEALEVDNAVRSISLWVLMTLVACSSMVNVRISNIHIGRSSSQWQSAFIICVSLCEF